MQFYVFRRKETGMENMFSRMDTLLEKLHLEWRIQDNGAIDDMVDITMQQYMEIEQILQLERKRFINTAQEFWEKPVLGNAFSYDK